MRVRVLLLLLALVGPIVLLSNRAVPLARTERASADVAVPLDTVYLPDDALNDPNGVYSNILLDSGRLYCREASGTFLPHCADTGVYRDAEYEFLADDWFRYSGGLNYNLWLGNLRIGELGAVYWGAANVKHTYRYEFPYTGTGQKLNLYLYDNAYGDNCGLLTVKIYPWLYCTSVGGTAELPDLAGTSAEKTAASGGGSGWSASKYAALASGMAAAVALTAVGGWYARRRWLQ